MKINLKSRKTRIMLALGVIGVMALLAVHQKESGSSMRAAAAAPNLSGAVAYLYKTTPSRPLYLYVLKPPAAYQGEHPAIVFFFGGGWTGGTTDQFDDQAQYFSRRGFVTLLADYRIKNLDGSTPFDSVRDARSALRWIRSHAAALQIDPSKVVAAGGSAGGHLAAATAMLADVNDPSDDLGVNPAPNALILFNPVLDTTKTGYKQGAKMIGSRAKELSLMERIGPGLPPTLIFHGTADHIVPFRNSADFSRQAKEAGVDCELVSFEGADHGAFNSPAFDKKGSAIIYGAVKARVDLFLQKIGFEKR